MPTPPSRATPSADPPGAPRPQAGPDGFGRLPEVAAGLAALADASPGLEICGLVVADAAGNPSIRPLPNAAPHPRRSFALAPEDLLAALRDLEGRGGALAAIFHSHPSGGADLSTDDLAQALCDGRPLWPGVVLVVVGLSGGRAEVVRGHRWDGERYRPADLWRRARSGEPGEGPADGSASGSGGGAGRPPRDP